MKQNSAGFSLMELMVAIAVSGVLTYAIISLIKEGTSAQKTLQAQDDARTLTDNFAMLLADTKACTNTFGSGAVADGGTGGPGVSANVQTGATVVTQILDGHSPPVSQFATGASYGGRGITLSKIIIGGPGRDAKSNRQQWIPGAAGIGTALVRVEWSQTKEGVGAKDLIRYFSVSASVNAGNQVVSCSALPGGSLGAAAAPDPTSPADDGYVSISNGGGPRIDSPNTTLNHGVYLVWFYNCSMGGAPDYFLQVSATFVSGTGTVGITNRLASQLHLYESVPFVLKVSSPTAVVQFYFAHMAGGSVAPDSSPCSGFTYTKISI